MRRTRIALAVGVATLLCSPASVAAGGASEILFQGLGDTHHEITTRSPRAQKYFDQGLVLAFGFNHREAGRSFLEAARLDPQCAMCYWGAAWVLGPNINAPMDPADAPPAWDLARKAVALAGGTDARERAYIAAVAARYVEHPPGDRGPLDAAYADGMRRVVEQFPGDLDARTLLAEAIMDQHPWDYWNPRSREPRPWTSEILDLLRGVLAAEPGHVFANHLFIHAVEASSHPEIAVPEADRLRTLVPGAGHLVHMPAHIYLRVGRYADASAANEAAIRADDAYVAQCQTGGIYPLGYIPHNWHFLWTTATFEGRSRRAIEAALETRRKVPPDKLDDTRWGILHQYYALPLYAYARFGKWREILDFPRPDPKRAYTLAVWHYARGLADVFTGNLDAADAERAALGALLREHEADLTKITMWEINTSYALMRIADHVLGGEIAAKRRGFDTAVAELNQAEELELSLGYDEPPDWYYPVRDSLGAVYLEAKRPAEAEKVYRTDLEWYPENGFALFGLEQALRAEGRTDEAASVHVRFERAWARADHVLTTSRF
jgi:tetratricopeptide (TPR) repeat protein